MGRLLKLNQNQRREAWQRKQAGEGLVAIASSFNVSGSTIEAAAVTTRIRPGEGN